MYNQSTVYHFHKCCMHWFNVSNNCLLQTFTQTYSYLYSVRRSQSTRSLFLLQFNLSLFHKFQSTSYMYITMYCGSWLKNHYSTCYFISICCKLPSHVFSITVIVGASPSSDVNFLCSRYNTISHRQFI